MCFTSVNNNISDTWWIMYLFWTFINYTVTTNWNTLYLSSYIVCSVFVHVSMLKCYWHSTCTCILFVCVFAHAIYICILMLCYVSDQTMGSRINYHYVNVYYLIQYFWTLMIGISFLELVYKPYYYYYYIQLCLRYYNMLFFTYGKPLWSSKS